MRGKRRVGRPATAAALAVGAAVALAACGIGRDGSVDDDPLTIYVSLPLRGPSGGDGRDAADGARMALADAGGATSGRAVRAVVLDGAGGGAAGRRWSPGRIGRNARRATRDASAIAYIGELESGATRTSLPITNEAGMLQVSPASAAGDLVREPGTFDGVPEALQPSGERSFGRVVPSDSAQARAGAQWALDLGRDRAVVVAERSRFGRAVADAFADEGSAAGLETERSAFAPRLRGLVREAGGRGIAEVCALPTGQRRPRLPPGLVYFAGEEPLALAVFGCLHPLPGEVFMGTDALLPGVEARRGERVVNDLHLTSAAQDPSRLPRGGRDLVARFRSEHGREPGRYAAYGYEAMALVLDSIERAGDGAGRAEVIDAFLATTERDSVLGTYSIDSSGETTLERMTGYRVERGEARPVADLR